MEKVQIMEEGFELIMKNILLALPDTVKICEVIFCFSSSLLTS